MVVDAYATVGKPIEREKASEVVQHFAKVDAPEGPSLDTTYTTTAASYTSAGGLKGMTGTKPGNIRFNMGKLYMAIAEGVFNSVGGVLTMPWLLFVAALILWGRLYAAATIQYPENEAAVLRTMWQRRDPKTRTVADAGLFEAVNAERDK